MTEDTENRLADLFERKFDGSISEFEHQQLEDLLTTDAEARNLYMDLALQHASLVNAGESMIQDELHSRTSLPSRKIAVAAAALVALFAIVFSLQKRSPQPVATLVSSDHASWESSLPTAPGSELHPGYLKLKSGLATIRFQSGAEMTIEAPAHIVLEDAMKARLYEGSIVVDVPKQAIGFEVETPDGVAIDLGTEFAVSVDSGKSVFEVLTGEIEVEHPATSEKIRLLENEVVVPSGSGWNRSLANREEGLLPETPGAIRLESDGTESTVIRGDMPDRIHPDLLMAKKSSILPEYDRKSIFPFDLSALELGDIENARLRLNLVPSGLGFAARLPETSRFSIYGFDGDLPVGKSPVWADLPEPGALELLGTFEISRGEKSGSFGIATDRLAQFLAKSQTGKVSFILERTTDEARGNGLVHAFAAGSHPVASGPSLEITLKNK